MNFFGVLVQSYRDQDLFAMGYVLHQFKALNTEK